jgi:uncharacterized protein YndB with AHSA1/START domain
MSSMISPSPIRRSITVDVPVDRAFEVFTASFGRWWPHANSIGSTPLKSAIIEPRTGGRWYEIGEDGSECNWGEVLVFEPPTRLLLAWRIGADWKFDHNLHTEVDITFTALSENRTQVDLEHRKLENLGEGLAAAKGAFESDGGWSGILSLYAKATA